MKIAVVGTGYVGLSLATLLSTKNEVLAYDLVEEKVNISNKRISPIKDKELEEYFKNKKLNLKATTDYRKAFEKVEFVIISTPTNYDEVTNYFDTTSVEDIIRKVISINKDATIVIKSTIPVGFTDKVKEKYKIKNIFFSPEFLREGHALYDNLYPSRIIVGSDTDKGRKFASILKECSLKEDIVVKYMTSTEAEAVKLFANTYLAVRVAFFNEIDTYAEVKHLNTKNIIEGVCLDPRIGDSYNNPSFGYGGYCLPKDTKQLLANYKDIPQNMIEAVVKSNETRKEHIVDMILAKKPKVVGIYRLTMKSNSDNFRASAILDIIAKLKLKNVDIVIYEPTIKDYYDFIVENDIEKFKEISDIIVANRYSSVLDDIKEKVYTRDLFERD